MSDSVKVRQPPSDRLQTAGIAVPNPSGKNVISRRQYEAMLRAYLCELIERNPNQAQQILTNSPEYSPDLYAISMGSLSKDYPSLILACDQMQMSLHQIDWNKTGENRDLDRSPAAFLLLF